jgi:hypothetical protein
MKAYCVKCKEKRDMKDPKKAQAKNDRWMMKGTCPHCGTKMFRFISDEEGKKKTGGNCGDIRESMQSLSMNGGDKKKRVTKKKGGDGEDMAPAPESGLQPAYAYDPRLVPGEPKYDAEYHKNWLAARGEEGAKQYPLPKADGVEGGKKKRVTKKKGGDDDGVSSAPGSGLQPAYAYDPRLVPGEPNYDAEYHKKWLAERGEEGAKQYPLPKADGIEGGKKKRVTKKKVGGEGLLLQPSNDPMALMGGAKKKKTTKK